MPSTILSLVWSKFAGGLLKTTAAPAAALPRPKIQVQIRVLEDGGRIGREWLPSQDFPAPYEYTLLSLEDAQKCDKIVYRMFPRRG